MGGDGHGVEPTDVVVVGFWIREETRKARRRPRDPSTRGLEPVVSRRQRPREFLRFSRSPNGSETPRPSTPSP